MGFEGYRLPNLLDKISVAPKPKNILRLEIDEAFFRCADQCFGKEYGFDDATLEEWASYGRGC